MKPSVGIIGVTGYSGQELLKILLQHPSVSVQYLASRRLKKPAPVGELLPAFRALSDLEIFPFHLSEALQVDLLFLTLPHGAAMEMAPRILRKEGIRVIDLSGDFRLHSPAAFIKAYKMPHRAAPLLRHAVYGIPEIHRESIRKTRWVANAGCYPTAALLALAPLAEAGLLEPEGLVVDAKSGASGAGRSAEEQMLFCEVNENLRAYRVGSHPHTPEMEQELQGLSRKKISVTFVPHLVPMDRGIYATLYAPLRRRIGEKQLRALYEKRYASEPFVGILPEGVWPQTKTVAGTNRCEMNLRLDSNGNRVIVICALDNLGKGAAGQAVQNMNLLLDFPETAGLSSEGGG